ncbi:hypothetical protein DFH09DRAFT_1313614 [Mycena vulgaris]|nr:hypothetical protein DFH09DRAFT_1313614 [Mycena vulgaris]
MIASLFQLLALASFAAASPAFITIVDPIAFGEQAGPYSAKIAGVDAQWHAMIIANNPTETLTFVVGIDYLSFDIVPRRETVTVGGADGTPAWG